MKTYFSRLHYKKKPGILDKIALVFLLPASFFYGLAVGIRNFLYDFGLAETKKLPAFVISVGNMTTGGTGKTPITAELAAFLSRECGKKTAVISRGYGGKLPLGDINVISNGENIFFDAEMAGDEPLWIAENCKETAVITGKNRYKSGKYAIDNFNSEVLILDDGFQHRKLYRDLNILLIDSDKAFGNNRVLPAGPLREPLEKIKRADKIIIVNKTPYFEDFKNQVSVLQGMLKEKYGKDSCLCDFIVDKIYNIATKQDIKGLKKVVAFSGIAQPESFFAFLRDLKINIVAERVFFDHYAYTQEDLKSLTETARAVNADAVVTTEKDSVKIRSFIKAIQPEIPVCTLKLKANLDVNDIISLIPQNQEQKL